MNGTDKMTDLAKEFIELYGRIEAMKDELRELEDEQYKIYCELQKVKEASLPKAEKIRGI